jgi:hypothetical protein
MTTYTESDLATETLRSAGLIGIDEVPSAAELVDTEQSNSSVLATLAAIGLPIWNGSEIQVPEEYFVELSIRLSMPLRLKNGMIDEIAYLRLIEASEARLTIMAAPRGASPLLARSNESTMGRSHFNWTTGQ